MAKSKQKQPLPKIVGTAPKHTIRLVKLADLKPSPYNPRKISEEAFNGLKNSLSKFGLVQNIVINKRTGNVVGGHQRISGLIEIGETEGYAIEVDISEAEEQALNVTLNNPAIQGEFTDDLQAMLDQLHTATPDLIDGLNLNDLWNGSAFAQGETDPDDVPPLPANPITVLGDLWQLGEHRLLCGDSTIATNVSRLLGAEIPKLMVTDPPYGVEYDANWRNEAERSNGKPFGARAVGKVSNDNRADWREAWALFPGNIAYVWHADRFAAKVAESLEATGFAIRNQIVWVKQQFVLSRGDYHWKHEPCWYAVKGTGNWTGDRKQTTVWEIDKPVKSETGHSTQKPVECMRIPMSNNSAIGDAVYDPFLGSGTSIIAAEGMKRRCFGLELDPAYCDVIVKRWENFTGEKAERVV